MRVHFIWLVLVVFFAPLTAHSYSGNQAASTTTLTVTPIPTFIAQTITVTAMVTGNGVTPTGTIQFKDNNANIFPSVALTGGTASTSFGYSVGTIMGTHTFVAVYSGDSNYLGSSSNAVEEELEEAPSTTTLASAQNPATTGTPVTFTATVSSVFGNPGPDVKFSATGQPDQVSTIMGGAATASFTFATSGSFAVEVLYGGGDGIHTMSSARLTQVVSCSTCIATTASLSAPAITPNDSGEPAGRVRLLQTATFTVTVTATSGSTAPVGTVHLQEDGIDVVAPRALTAGGSTSSTAVFTITGLTVGPHNFVAVYDGDQTTFGGSLSSTSSTLQREPKPH